MPDGNNRTTQAYVEALARTPVDGSNRTTIAYVEALALAPYTPPGTPTATKRRIVMIME